MIGRLEVFLSLKSFCSAVDHLELDRLERSNAKYYTIQDDSEGSLVSEARGSKRSSKLAGEDEERSKKAKM